MSSAAVQNKPCSVLPPCSFGLLDVTLSKLQYRPAGVYELLLSFNDTLILRFKSKMYLWIILQLDFSLFTLGALGTNSHAHTLSCETELVQTCIPACMQIHAAQISHTLRNVPKGNATQSSRKWERHCGNDVKTIEQLGDLRCINTHIKQISPKEGLTYNLARNWQNQEVLPVIQFICVYVWEKEMNLNAILRLWRQNGSAEDFSREKWLPCAYENVCNWMVILCVRVSDLELL